MGVIEYAIPRVRFERFDLNMYASTSPREHLGQSVLILIRIRSRSSAMIDALKITAQQSKKTGITMITGIERGSTYATYSG